MKTFAGMLIDDFKKELDEERQKWSDLEANDPEEYKRRVAAMQPTIDRYNSEYGIGDDEPDIEDEED